MYSEVFLGPCSHSSCQYWLPNMIPSWGGHEGHYLRSLLLSTVKTKLIWGFTLSSNQFLFLLFVLFPQSSDHFLFVPQSQLSTLTFFEQCFFCTQATVHCVITWASWKDMLLICPIAASYQVGYAWSKDCGFCVCAMSSCWNVIQSFTLCVDVAFFICFPLSQNCSCSLDNDMLTMKKQLNW